jgi:hypothetical protein
MFTDDYSRYTEVCFMKAKSEAPAKFKEYVAKVEKQHPKKKVCRIRVDGGGEYGSREKFLEYLAEEGIVREVSAPYSQQQNGLSERCNRSVMDPARSMLKHAGMPNKFWAEAVSTAVYIKNRLPTRATPDSTPFERWNRKKPDISHLRTFGCLAFAWIHGDLRKKLDNHAYKCVLLGYSVETTTQYRVMDISSGRVFMARDIKFDESTLYYQLLKFQQRTKVILEPAEPSDNHSWVEQPPEQVTVQQKKTDPIDDYEDGDLTPPPETPEPSEISGTPEPTSRMIRELQSNLKNSNPASTSRTRKGASTANISIAMMIEPGPKTYKAAMEAEDSDQWKEAIGKEVTSMEDHEVFTFVEKVPEGASMIQSRWVMGRKLLANGQIDKWKVRLVGRGDQQKPGDYNDITSPVIDSTSTRLALGLAAKLDLEIAVLDIPTAFLGCPLHETLYMQLPDGEWPDPHGRARPIVKLNKTLYGIKQANREYYEEVFDYIVDDLGLKASVAAPGLFYGGKLGSKDGVLIPVYVDDIMIIGSSAIVTSIASRLHDRFKAAGQVPVPDTFQYLGMTITRDRKTRSITIDQIGYINRVLDRFEMTDSRKRSTPMEAGYKPHALREEDGEKPYQDVSNYQKAIGSLLYAALGTRPDITYAITVLGRYAAKPSVFHWEAVKHLLRYLRGTSEYKLTIYDPDRSPESSILCYADADLGGEIDTSKSTSGIVVYALGNLVIWKSKKQTLVAQSTMQAEMIATAYGKVQVDWLKDVISEIGFGIGIAKQILNDGLNCITTLNSGNFQSESRHLRLRFHSIHEAVAKRDLEIRHIPGTEMKADALTKALGGVKLGEFVEEIGLR